MVALATGQVMMWNGSLWVNAELNEAIGVYIYDPRSFGSLTTNSAGLASTNAASIQAALTAAGAAAEALSGPTEVWLPAGKFWISTTLTVPSLVTLRGQGMGRTTLYMPASSFTNTTIGTHNTTSLGIEASGLRVSPYTQAESITLRDFTLECEVSDGRVLYGIRCDNVDNPVIDGVEVLGLPVGNLIELNSVFGGAVRNCYLHNSTTALTTYASQPQLTGIEVDNNKINSVEIGRAHV